MEGQLALFFLIGGAIYADTDAVGQFMFSQPLVACTLAGWVLGNVGLGLSLGALLQLPFVVETPVGGAKVSVISVGAYVAAGVAARVAPADGETGLFMAAALIYAILLSVVAVPLQEGLRRFNQVLVHQADAAAEYGRLEDIARLNYLGATVAWLFGAVFTVAFFWTGLPLLRFIAEMSAPPLWFHGLEPVMLGAGMGALGWHFSRKRVGKFTLAMAGISGIILWSRFA